MTKVRHVHQSSRYDRSKRSVKRNARRNRRLSDLDTYTEMAEEHRAEMLGQDKSHGLRRGKGFRNADDVATSWNKIVWKFLHTVTVPLTEFGGGSGVAPVSGLFVVLQHRLAGFIVLVQVTHWPTGVQSHSGLNRTPKAHEYIDGLIKAKSVRKQLEREFDVDYSIVTGDWNLDLRMDWVGPFLRNNLGLPRTTWSGHLPKLGTRNKRVIDFSLTDFDVVRARVLDQDGSSDHRGYVEVLRTR